MSNTIILDSVYDPFDVARVIYAEVAVPGDPGFDALDTGTRTVFLGMIFDLDQDDPRILAAHRPVNPVDFGLTA